MITYLFYIQKFDTKLNRDDRIDIREFNKT